MTERNKCTNKNNDGGDIVHVRLFFRGEKKFGIIYSQSFFAPRIKDNRGREAGEMWCCQRVLPLRRQDASQTRHTQTVSLLDSKGLSVFKCHFFTLLLVPRCFT